MWTVLRSFQSEPEARVVETFLQSHDIDVQLLGTHLPSTMMAPGSVRSAGLRLMVRSEQLAAAEELLREQEARAHLSVVTPEGPPPKIETRWDKRIIAMFLVLVALLALLKWLQFT